MLSPRQRSPADSLPEFEQLGTLCGSLILNLEEKLKYISSVSQDPSIKLEVDGLGSLFFEFHKAYEKQQNFIRKRIYNLAEESQSTGIFSLFKRHAADSEIKGNEEPQPLIPSLAASFSRKRVVATNTKPSCHGISPDSPPSPLARSRPAIPVPMQMSPPARPSSLSSPPELLPNVRLVGSTRNLRQINTIDPSKHAAVECFPLPVKPVQTETEVKKDISSITASASELQHLRFKKSLNDKNGVFGAENSTIYALQRQITTQRNDFQILRRAFVKAAQAKLDVEKEILQCKGGAMGLSVVSLKMGYFKTKSTGLTNILKRRNGILTTSRLYIFRANTDVYPLYELDLSKSIFQMDERTVVYVTVDEQPMLELEFETVSEKLEWHRALAEAANSAKIPLKKFGLADNETFINALIANDFALSHGIATAAGKHDKGEDVAQLLFDCLNARDETLPFLRIMVENESEATTSPGTLFRSNSTASRVLRWYANYIGKAYLKSTLQAPIQTILEKNFEMEIFESKVTAGTSRQQNIQNCTEAFHILFNAITTSHKLIPWQLKFVMYHYRESIQKKFPETRETNPTGSFFFLRFLNPAILVPSIFNFEPTIPPHIQRGLLYITKILQNMSNFVEFGAKEQEMLVFNPLMSQSGPAFRLFLNQISEATEFQTCQTGPQLADPSLQLRRRVHLMPELEGELCMASAWTDSF